MLRNSDILRHRSGESGGDFRCFPGMRTDVVLDALHNPDAALFECDCADGHPVHKFPLPAKGEIRC
jgi:hypothetical protein